MPMTVTKQEVKQNQIRLYLYSTFRSQHAAQSASHIKHEVHIWHFKATHTHQMGKSETDSKFHICNQYLHNTKRQQAFVLPLLCILSSGHANKEIRVVLL